ncbi:winged helix-turn-helix transcriptional regulator [Proteiniborus sp. DW1]|nr:winged helix-turn-helix transcriptional regulator [Proteiniborus sp. DW1]
MIQNKSKEEKERILRELLKIKGVSTRQLARATGVSPNLIWRL